MSEKSLTQDVYAVNKRVEKFPVSVFPKPFADMAQAVTDAVGCPVDFAACGILSAVATALGASREIQVDRTWKRLPVFWVLLVGKPGDKKSPALSLALKPIVDEDERLYELWKNQVDEWEARGNEGPRPVLRNAVVDDTTVEGLVQALESNPRGLLLYNDELVFWLKSFDAYRKGGGARDRSFYNKVWSEAPVSTTRATKGPARCPRPCLNIIGGTQPDVAKEFFSGQNDGFRDRFLVSFPTELPLPQLPGEGEGGVPEDIERRYHEVIGRLLELQQRDGRPVPVPMREDARLMLRQVKWEAEVEAQAVEGPDAGFLAKFGDTLARFSLVMQAARWAAGEASFDAVDIESVAMATELFAYFRTQRAVLLGTFGLPHMVEKLVGWMRRRGVKVASQREIRQGIWGVKTVEEAREVMLQAVAAGVGSIQERQERNGTFWDFWLNDDWHEG